MIQTFVSGLSSRYGIFATTFAGFGGLAADAFFGKTGFAFILIVALLFLWLAIREEKAVETLYKNETIPIPIVISVDDNTPMEILFTSLIMEIEKDEKFKGLEEKLKKYFTITSEMLTFKYTGDMYDNDRLISFLQIIRYELNDIQSRLDNKAEFHIIYLKRPAVGFALGGMFRSDGIVIYQNNDYKNRLDKVVKIDSRRYKEKVFAYEKFDVINSLESKEDKKLLIVIQISSHNISLTSEKLKAFKNVVSLISRGNGTISVDKKEVDEGEWIAYAQEIYNVINRIKDDFDEITLVHSMPEAVAVVVGMALENYWNINICQYDDSAYKKVINLKDIKYYF